MNKQELETKIKGLMQYHGAKIYGDEIIGYRMKSFIGIYLDDEMEDLYNKCNDVLYFCEICEKLKSGCHNW